MYANTDATAPYADANTHTYADMVVPGIVSVNPAMMCVVVAGGPNISITAVHIGVAMGVIALVSDGDADLRLRRQRQTTDAGEKQSE